MSPKDISKESLELVHNLMDELRGDFGAKLLAKIGDKLRQTLTDLLGKQLPVTKARKLTASSTEQILGALRVQFDEGLPPAEQRELARKHHTLIAQEIASGATTDAAWREATHAVVEAIESWVFWLTEALTGVYFDVLRTHPGGTPQLLVARGKKRPQ